MNEITGADQQASDKTQPPVSSLRYETPVDIYAALPQLAELTQHRPRNDEDVLAYLRRLRSSTTPEESVTYTAFSAVPQMAIWWAYECLQAMPDYLDNSDRLLMGEIANWIKVPSTATRHSIMKEALWAPARSPAVLLGLAVGWSGGSVAPNDPLSAPVYRTPMAINTAVLSSLARSDMTRRPIFLARFIDMAESLFRVY